MHILMLVICAAANPNLDLTYSDTQASWDDFIKRVNNAIDALDLEFRHLQDERDGRQLYSLVSEIFLLLIKG
jgi:hypothetical protein